MGNVAVICCGIVHVWVELVIQINIIRFAQAIFDVYDLFHGLAEIDESILGKL